MEVDEDEEADDEAGGPSGGKMGQAAVGWPAMTMAAPVAASGMDSGLYAGRGRDTVGARRGESGGVSAASDKGLDGAVEVVAVVAAEGVAVVSEGISQHRAC